MIKTALVVLAWLFLSVGVTGVMASVPLPTPTGGMEKEVILPREVWDPNFVKMWWGGVPENTAVLLLMLPLVATLVSLLHYVVGLSGYGIFIPTMIAVTLLATGVVGGLALFGVILTITLLSNWFLRKLKLHFWPARSITLLFVGLGTFGVMAGTNYLRIFDVSKISIFPILFMILLTEEFVRTQLIKSKKEAIRLTVGTLILAGVGAMTMGIKGIQEIVLKYPWMVVLLVIVTNIMVGSYGGIRLTEIKRFKGAIRKK